MKKEKEDIEIARLQVTAVEEKLSKVRQMLDHDEAKLLRLQQKQVTKEEGIEATKAQIDDLKDEVIKFKW